MVRRMLLTAMAVATMALALVAAPAAAQYNITVAPDEVLPGGTATVTGDLCAPGAEVTVTLGPLSTQRDLDEPIQVGSGQADDEGNYSVDIQVPADLDPGTYQLSVFCDGSFVDSVQITVVAPGTPTTPGTPGDDDIVRTGSDLNGLGLLGAGLLVGGGIVLFATRSRRHASA